MCVCMHMCVCELGGHRVKTLTASQDTQGCDGAMEKWMMEKDDRHSTLTSPVVSAKTQKDGRRDST